MISGEPFSKIVRQTPAKRPDVLGTCHRLPEAELSLRWTFMFCIYKDTLEPGIPEEK